MKNIQLFALVITWSVGASLASAQMIPVAKSFNTTSLVTNVQSVVAVPVESPDMLTNIGGDKENPTQSIAEIQPVTPVVTSIPAVMIPNTITANTSSISSSNSNTQEYVENPITTNTIISSVTANSSGNNNTIVSGGVVADTGVSNNTGSSSSNGSSKKSGTLVATKQKTVDVVYVAPVYEKQTFDTVTTASSQEVQEKVSMDDEVKDIDFSKSASVYGLETSVSLIGILLVIASVLGIAALAREYSIRKKLTQKTA